MKNQIQNVFASLIIGAVAMATVPAQAHEVVTAEQLAVTIATLNAPAPLDLINWKVGDTMNYKVTLMMGLSGTNVKSVTKDEGTALWIKQDMNLQIQKQVAEILINKADGKILKMLVNGQEQQIPDDKVEIISQEYTDVTVPAGTFKSIHVVAKTQQVSKLEVWQNPRDTAMDGSLKQIAATQFGNITMELTGFKRMP